MPSGRVAAVGRHRACRRPKSDNRRVHRVACTECDCSSAIAAEYLSERPSISGCVYLGKLLIGKIARQLFAPADGLGANLAGVYNLPEKTFAPAADVIQGRRSLWLSPLEPSRRCHRLHRSDRLLYAEPGREPQNQRRLPAPDGLATLQIMYMVGAPVHLVKPELRDLSGETLIDHPFVRWHCACCPIAIRHVSSLDRLRDWGARRTVWGEVRRRRICNPVQSALSAKIPRSGP